MSTFSRRTASALTTVIVAAVLSAGSTATAGAPRLLGVDPDFEKPRIGECHNYGLAVVKQVSDSSPVVPCGTTHTAKVFATPMLPESLEWATVTQDQLLLTAVKACTPGFRSILGRTESLRQRSAYNFSWFEPTQAQKDAGARWLRCDLILEGGNSLQPIRRNVAPILQASPLPNSVTSCLAGNEPIRLSVCSKTHRYRATGTYRVERTYFPGDAILFQIAKRVCPSRVSTPRFWYAMWMSRYSWKAGDRTITCYSHTSS